jgi:hypothetical protein
MDQKTFDQLLRWLHPDREEAGRRYEEIRRQIINLSRVRGYIDPEAAADEAIDHVARLLPELPKSYSGDPFGYALKIVRRSYGKPRSMARTAA